MTSVLTLFTHPVGAPPGLDETADRILDAAVHSVAAGGVARLTMDDVVRRSGLGRMTVYRRFGGRDALLDALAARETARFLAAVAQAMDAADPADRVVASFLAALSYARTHPILRRIGEVDPGGFVEAVAADGAATLEIGRSFLVRALRDGAPGRPTARERGVADVCARLFVSYVAMPPDFTEREARRFAIEVLGPLVRGLR